MNRELVLRYPWSSFHYRKAVAPLKLPICGRRQVDRRSFHYRKAVAPLKLVERHLQGLQGEGFHYRKAWPH